MGHVELGAVHAEVGQGGSKARTCGRIIGAPLTSGNWQDQRALRVVAVRWRRI